MAPKFTKEPKKEEEGYIKPQPRRADKEGKDKKEGRHAKRKERETTLEFKKGGKVKETGKAVVHKGEVVLPVSVVNKMKALFK